MSLFCLNKQILHYLEELVSGFIGNVCTFLTFTKYTSLIIRIQTNQLFCFLSKKLDDLTSAPEVIKLHIFCPKVPSLMKLQFLGLRIESGLYTLSFVSRHCQSIESRRVFGH